MSDYVLALSDAEVARYRFMAQTAGRDEAGQWASAGVVEGATVADVGCGPGAVSVVLAEVVGRTGMVRAVDRDPQALSLARDAATKAGLSNIVFSEGSATATGLAAGGADVVMLRHVLAHNGGHEQAIVDHLATLVRPGGSVYLVDIDQTAMRWRPSEGTEAMTEMTDRYQQFHSGLGNDLSVGLRLGELLERAGLEQVDHRGRYTIMRPTPGMRPPLWAAREQMLAAGVIDEDDIARWQAQLERMDSSELRLTMFIPSFVATARRPT
ncbi:MAG: methyltransferase domain-containing protein [Actinomycetota bacterium]